MSILHRKILVLAIETSCDETAISVLRFSKGLLEIISNEVSSQVKLHAKWGGVVPNLAAREHVKNITPIFELALKNAGVSVKDINFIAVTEGPGLIPALMVGNNFAKTLAYLLKKPLLGIHHIEGHIYANFVGADKKIKFPILCLVVSGGHTQLVLMKNHLKYEIVGQTLDDAVGEAFDKVARILRIGYPGGPRVAQWATKFKISNLKFKIKLPRPMLNKQGFNFSFSGLKTAVLYETKKHPELLKDEKYISAVCHEFQQATIDVLVSKTLKAAEKYKPKTIMLAGGVSANAELRKQLGEAIKNNLSNVSYCIPDLSLTGDNAAMIGSAAAFRWQKMSETQKKKTLNGWKTLQPDANLKLK
jgi:N6-L-threonylcarbamoyladenine synthase